MERNGYNGREMRGERERERERCDFVGNDMHDGG